MGGSTSKKYSILGHESENWIKFALHSRAVPLFHNLLDLLLISFHNQDIIVAYTSGTLVMHRPFSQVSRADVTHFMLTELENPRHVQQSVSLCY